MSKSNLSNTSTYEIMEYLSKKLICKANELNNFLKGTAKCGDFNNIIGTLVVELRQASFAIKALLTENKSLYAEIQQLKGVKYKLQCKPQNIKPKENPPDLLFKIVEHPFIIKPLKEEYGRDIFRRLIQKEIPKNELNQINDHCDFLICNGPEENTAIPLRIQLSNREGRDSFSPYTNRRLNITSSSLKKSSRSFRK